MCSWNFSSDILIWWCYKDETLIIAFRSRFKQSQVFAIAKWAIALLTFFLLLQFALSMFKAKKVEAVSSTPKVAVQMDFDKMLTGPLGLYESKRSPFALALEQKLVLLVQNVRPDLGQGEKTFRLGVKGAEQQKVVNEGEPIFFNLVEHSSGAIEKIEFSDSPLDKQMTPYILDGCSMLLKVDEDEELILQAVSEQSKGMDFFDGLKAKWWGNDLFFREYGGAEYQTLGLKHKIEFSDGSKRYFVFVQPKDYLTLKGNRWQVVSSLSEADREAPLAVVQAISNNQLELEAWDVDGRPLFQAKMALEKNSPIRFSPEQFIVDPKLRSGALVSCKIGKKRLVLKPNDWVIKTETGWRKLITISEIESYLNNDLMEELFVIDAIDAGGQMRGRHFDPMRVQMKPFTILATSSKGKSTKKRIRPAK